MIQSAFVRRALHIGVMALLGGCERELEPAICPDIGAGDLVISEVRGLQSDTDTQGQWIELYNASGAAIDLRGLALLLRKVDGSDEGKVLVRRSVTVAPGDYVVLSYFDDVARPAHVDYGWLPDFINADGDARSLFSAGAIDVLACDLRIDRVVSDDLPGSGTWSLGVAPPDATANDADAAWCVDTTDDTDPATLGLPGTPGASNHPCPSP